MLEPARLVLEDGTSFEGYSFGARTPTSGEVVFNTGMVGYPESFTDPSYSGQILTLTYPLIGNYGVAPKGDGLRAGPFESDRAHIAGLVVTEYVDTHSHWSAARSLSEWLREEGVPAITGIDTRALTKRLRVRGTMLGRIAFNGEEVPLRDPNLENLVARVSTPKVERHERGPLQLALVDCGSKRNILRSLLARNASVTVVPWDHDFNQESFDGIVVSNGPGDPKLAERTIQNVRKALEAGTPTLGICLGHQLLALAAGADTYKLRFGHRGQNQPCLEQGGQRCYITSQNHGFAVDEKSLPRGWRPWFTNANDGTNEGIRHERRPFLSVQFHPEACPGPTDTGWVFDLFIEQVSKWRK